MRPRARARGPPGPQNALGDSGGGAGGDNAVRALDEERHLHAARRDLAFGGLKVRRRGASAVSIHAEIVALRCRGAARLHGEGAVVVEEGSKIDVDTIVRAIWQRKLDVDSLPRQNLARVAFRLNELGGANG